MTFSQSIRRSQFPINCQLCEVDPNIQWKCQDCNLLMCQTCNDKIHPKFKNACKHRICDVKEVGIINEEQDIIIDFSNIPCQIHQGQDCCVFCKACDYLICATCVSTTHNGHTMGEIKEFYEIKMNTVRKVKTDVKFKQRRLKEDELSLARINKYKSESYIHAKKDIISQTTTLTDAVALYSDKLLSDLDRDHQYITKAYDEDKETIQNMKLRINKNINEIEDISRITDAAKFFKQFENLTLMEKDLPLLAFPDDTVMEFDSGKITQSNFGSLHKMKKISKCEIMLEASKEFQTELKCIHYIAVDNNNSFWITDFESSVLQKIKHDGNHHEMLHSFNIKAYGMAINSSNDLLLCIGDSRILQINNGTDDIIDSKYNVAPFDAVAIHITRENVIVCGGHTPAVIVMDLVGKKLAVYRHNNNIPLFNHPLNITSTKNGNIFVLDFNAEAETCKVVVIGAAMKILNMYEGNKDINTRRPLKSIRIATTPKDYVVVTDTNNSLLHVLDSDGQFITYYKTEDVGIFNPVSMAFNSEGQLYIGCHPPENSLDKATLYEVNIYEY